jgi:hypothetical protein
VVFISRGVKSSLRRELDSFYKEVTGGDFNIREVTKGAFIQARAKLAFPIEEKVKIEYEREKGFKHQQKINRTNALSMTREICIGLILKN